LSLKPGAIVALSVALCLIASAVASADGAGSWFDDFASTAMVDASQNVTIAFGGVGLTAEMAVRDGVVLGPLAGSAGETAAVQSPSVVRTPSGFRMYYAGTSDFSSTRIFMASSPDGTTWTRQGIVLDLGAPGSGEEQSVGYPDVVYNGSQYTMWYSGSSGSGYSIFLATSADGMNWTRQGRVLGPGPRSSDAYQVYQPWVLSEGGVFRMWYTGSNITHVAIMYAISTDGRNWTKEGVVLAPGAAGILDAVGNQYPAVIHASDGYLMWHTCTSQSLTDVLCLASSTDGLSWTERGPLLDLLPGTSESRNLILGTVMARAAGGFDIWYAGRGSYFQIFRASLDRALAPLGWVRSTIIRLPKNQTWAWIDVKATIPAGTSVQVSVLDGASGQPIPGLNGITPGNETLSALGTTVHPTIRLNASLASSAGASPMLLSWAVGWVTPTSSSTFDWSPILFTVIAGASTVIAVVLLFRRSRPPPT
jgi:predicted GH43/DUF377 family glycosyl hydrolase